MALTETELLSILQSEITGAVGYHSSELADQRKTALEYYYGEPFGNEAEGRSTYVSRDVADTIEWIMPSLMRIFTGGDTIVRFEPQGPEDEQKAQQVTDYINHVFVNQSDGFLVLYTWFKDALLSKNGFVKVYWEKYTDYKTETYEKLTDDEFAMVLQDDVEPLEHTEDVAMDEMGMPQRVHSLKIRKKTDSGKCCIVPVPPEEVLVNKNPTAPFQKNRFRAHRRRVSIGDLIEMELIESADDIPADNDDNFNEETIARFAFDETDNSLDTDPKDPLSREVWVSECYRKIDFDGDGIAEERTITICGNKVLKNEEGYTANLISITPIILPHKLFGMSIADLVMDLQLLKSTVFRQILDNMYLANNGRYMALDGMVNIDDLLTSRPGGIVRVKTFDAVKPMQPPLLGAPAFNLLEYIDVIKENRTGVTRYNQGLDADSLNKTATGINQIMSASQSRIELIARVFAETGVKDLFYAILENVQKYQDHSKVIRLKNEWVQMDPREWTSKFDMSVTVGLGTGSKESQLMALNEETQYQAAAIQAGLPIVTPENIYNLRMKALEAKNIKGGDLFYTHPSKMPPPQPQQNPDAIKLQLEDMKRQGKEQLQQQKAQNDMVKQEQKQSHEQQKMEMQAMIDAALQANEQRAQAQQQAQQQVGDAMLNQQNNQAQAQESDKTRKHDTDSKVLDILWEKKKGEEEAQRGQQQEELKTVLAIMQDNSKAQNEAILKAVEAMLAERETEVSERDAKGKVKKTVSRVKK
jgi:hypothetical protein